MALIQFKRGVIANMDAQPTNGVVYFATDTKEVYMADATGWKRYGDGDKLVSDVTYSNGVVTIAYNDGTTASTTFNSLASVSDSAVTDQFVTAISATNGVVSATRSGITASQVTRTATTGEHGVAATTVEGAIQELAAAVDAGGTGSIVTVEKQQTAESGYAATYVVKQGGSQVGVKINIPKDFLVKSASVETVATADTPYAGAEVGDKYIDFVVNTTDASETAQHIYLPVNELVDVYTDGNGISISNSNVVSADIDTANGLKFTGNTEGSKQIAVNVKSGDSYIEIDSNGAIASKGIDSAISTAVGNAKNAIDAYTVNGNGLSNGNWQVDGGDISVDDSAATPETIAAAISRLGTAAGAASDKVDTEIAKLDGNATASGTASAASGVTKTSYIYVLNKVDEVDGKVNAVGSGSTQTAVDVAGAANAAYTDAVSYIDTAIAGLDATVTDSCDATAAAASGVTKTSYVSVANGVTVVEADGVLTSVTLNETSVDAAGAADAAYTAAVAYTDSKLTWIEA